MGAGFLAVKSGLLQPSESDSPLSGTVMMIESKVTGIDSRLSVLERKLSDTASALNPAEHNEVPEETVPDDAMMMAPAEPATPEAAKPEEGAAAPESPAAEEGKEAAPAAEPHTKDETTEKDGHVRLEKKRLNMAANTLNHQ